jgi:hypothetical protein
VAKEKFIAQERAKSYFDHPECRAVSFAVGDGPAVNEESQAEGHKLERTKLMPRFIGPYRVCERIGLVAYKLKLPDLNRSVIVSCQLALTMKRGYQPPPTYGGYYWRVKFTLRLMLIALTACWVKPTVSIEEERRYWW